MRDFQVPGRSVAVGHSGMVATSNPAAALVGLDVLRSGGNAIDAAVAIAAMLAVVEPTQTGIGGDCFVLLKRPGHAPVALDGAGWAPKAVNVERLRETGKTAINPASADAVTVPGALSAWERLAAEFGALPFDTLLAPAIKAAEDGYAVTERLARDWGRQTAKMSATPEAAELFLNRGAAPAAGARQTNKALAETLREISRKGAAAFYRGWIAEDIVGFLRRLGGSHTMEDFAEFKAEYVQPVSCDYRGHRLWECPPSGQGIIALQIAGMLETFDVARFAPLSAERFHLQGEISRIAYTQRDAYLCDPSSSEFDWDRLTSSSHVRELASKVSMQKRLADLTPFGAPEHRDTVYVTVVDKDGIVVSLINSIFDDFGSGLVAPRSGVLLHNRGCGFVLEQGHPNELAGRKRPLHTIIPALITKDDEAVMSFGVTGGHFQPAGQLQVLSNALDYGMSVQEAIDHPRMFARGNSFEVERTVPQQVVTALRELGHPVVTAENPLGTCHAIWIDRAAGALFGGTDPRRDGLAIGY
ncbi:gamma-glutamyltransferase 2 [Trinickia symbiotica]|uniref:Glutathione hydrolase proenzyme n=1 Tax=Trinickia symbiotica TaxID=863227 RepID=A0A2N7X4V3_9BURK|nr:gamma-glutamyltransferase [Trinickia symbiotica]PMS36798.1 gamma-glutamyltransferase [Trinickia symbiotica]PPK46250.1 gamma-glutamyltransferase 2 [Trinickia symbiotica]